MAYKNLRAFIERLKDNDELVIIDHPVSRELEITEITDRISKSNGPALLFTNVKESDFPVLINAYGSFKRMAWSLGVEDIEDIASDIEALIKTKPAEGFMDKLKLLPKLKELASSFPKTVKKGACQEVIIKNPDLNKLPVLKCWPLDGGPFITLPVVISKDPDSGIRNLGMYRMQVYDKNTTGMHWHIHKVGARHYQRNKELGKKMELAVSLGGDPAITFSASAPLPDNVDEFLFAGYLRKEPVKLVKAITVDIEVPAEAEFIIEGYVDPEEELRMEGPFGDHTGYYSLADNYPVFHVTCITHRKNPVYPATIVGRPPMEDCYMAKATERIFLPLIKMTIPEIVDMNLPIEGVFHNIAIISIKKQFPAHARKIMHALWGLGQMMFTKALIIVDDDVNVQDPQEVVWRVANNIDAKRDIVFVDGPVDCLDHASQSANVGSKMGIDATRKWKSEGFEREWPPTIEMDKSVKDHIDTIWDSIFK